MTATATLPSTTGSVVTVDQALVAEATAMRRRAAGLRHEADGVANDLVARSFRRRASELELEAWVLEVRAGVPSSELHPAA
jgi:hypothetical protein